MASGFKALRYNTQERAISPDQNRAQTFTSHGVMEIFRYLMTCATTDDVDAGGNVTEAVTGATPAYCKILNGLEVRPQTGAGQLSLQVKAGAAMVLADDGDSDASQWKLAVDPGIPSNGLLLMTTNPAGSARIDVIEVQWSSIITSSDNRDIFNAATGLFAATNVTKSTAGTLTDFAAPNIRVRAGTAGAGYPGNAAGWTPLCVAYNPAGSTQCDDMDFWDVRPLVGDLRFNLTESSALPKQERFVGSGNDLDSPGHTYVSGVCESTIGSRRVGGRLLTGCPSTDGAAAFDAQAARDQESGFTPTATGLWFLYLLTPFGLPRWARYTRTGPRVPRSPRGIPVVSMVGPSNTSGSPTAAIPLPAATGLGGTTSSGVCVMAGQLLASAPRGGVSSGKCFLLSKIFQSFGHYGYAPLVGSTNDKTLFSLQDNVTHPANARTVLISIRLTITLTSAGVAYTWADDAALVNGCGVLLGTPTTNPDATHFVASFDPGVGVITGGSGSSQVITTSVMELPLFSGYPVGTPITRQIAWVHNFATNCLGGTATVSAADMKVLGWSMGD